MFYTCAKSVPFIVFAIHLYFNRKETCRNQQGLWLSFGEMKTRSYWIWWALADFTVCVCLFILFHLYTLFVWLWLVIGADLLWEKSIAGWLAAGAGLVCEKNTVSWLQPNRVLETYISWWGGESWAEITGNQLTVHSWTLSRMNSTAISSCNNHT